MSDDHEQAGGDERGEEGVDAEVPDFCGWEIESGGDAHGEIERHNEGDGGGDTVGGKDEVAELKKAGKH